MISVGRRLTVALLPAIFGLFAAVALAYYGEYARQAPEWFVAVAIISTLASVVIAWRNTRYVANRVERLVVGQPSSGGAVQGGPLQRAAAVLAASGTPLAAAPATADELETIERLVERLTSVLSGVQSDRERLTQELHDNRALYAALVSRSAEDVLRALEEVRLPLHILLENRFGELNENQEEMLGAARSAAELADQQALRLRDLAALDLGTMRLRADAVRLADLLATITPGLSAAAAERDVELRVEAAPALPSFIGDRERLQEALAVVLRDAMGRTPRGARLSVTAEAVGGELRVVVAGAEGLPSGADRALPWRILQAHGGRLEDSLQGMVITLPLPKHA